MYAALSLAALILGFTILGIVADLARESEIIKEGI